MAKTPKWQLVASVSVTVTGATPRLTRVAIFRIKLGPESTLRCTCTYNTPSTYDPESLAPPSAGCSHVHALYDARRFRSFVYRIQLTPLGREMFTWRYAAEALK